MGKEKISEEEKIYWLAFSWLEGIGPRRFALLKNYFGSAKAAWQAGEEEWRAVGLGEKTTADCGRRKRQFSPEAFWDELATKKIKVCFLGEEGYPSLLAKIDDPPSVLYYRGEWLPVEEKVLAVVGTRRMSAYGAQATESLAGELADAGVTIVSGLARGVDTVAHRTVLAVKGRTVAVFGSGLERVYPPENRGLAKLIAEGRGAVVSEYPPERAACPGFFPARNRLIAGLSQGVVVTEGGEKSGSLITAKLAAEMGREVFAVPGPIFNPGSRGTTSLVNLGAKLVLSGEMILAELGWEKSTVKMAGNEKEEGLLLLLEREPKQVDELAWGLGKPVGEVLAVLTMLELKGKVKNLGGMKFSLKKG